MKYLYTTLILLLSIIVPSLTMISCVSGDVDAITSNISSLYEYSYDSSSSSSSMSTKTIKVGTFTQIEASQVNVIVTVGKATGTARLEAPAALMDYIKIQNKNGKLVVKIDNDRNKPNRSFKNATLYVTASTLESIDASLSATVKLDKGISTGDMDIEVSTSGRVIIPSLKVGTCDLNASTSGTINISTLNTTGQCRFDATTSGDISISSLTASSLKAECSTSGSIQVSGGNVKKARYEATTSGSINCAKLAVASGSAEASTSGSVKCSIKNSQYIETSTGGHVHNN